MNINSKNIFLLDGIGAAFSTLLTGLLLPFFSDWLGLSKQTLSILALFPLAYGIYSFNIYFFANKTKPWMLLGIVIANLIYCLISAALLISSDSITIWGQALLTMEILVILGVIMIELKIYKNL